MTTKRTKNLRIKAYLLTFLSLILSWGPLILYVTQAYLTKTAATSDKIILTSLLAVGVIMSIVCLINKYVLRCRSWLILIGLWLCLDKILGCILVIAITQCLDEIIVQPLARSFRNKLTINKEIDKRNG